MHERYKRSAPASVPLKTQGLLRPVLMSAAFFMAVTGLAYPLLTTGAAQVLFGDRAGGSLIERNGQIVGSKVIGQYFTRPGYFHGTPSVTSGPDPADPSRTVDQPYNAGSSGASNQGVLSKKLHDAVTERANSYRQMNGLAADAQVPVDAVTASASGLDPHISVANARLQAPRVAKVRGLSTEDVLSLLDQHTSGRQLGILGDPRVNVLELNLALDATVRSQQSAP